jgi:hypothetical protein
LKGIIDKFPHQSSVAGKTYQVVKNWGDRECADNLGGDDDLEQGNLGKKDNNTSQDQLQ